MAAVRAPLAPPWPRPAAPGTRSRGSTSRDPEHVTDAAARLLRWLDAAAGEASAVGLLGFSQGAAVAIQALRLDPERFAFVGQPQRLRDARRPARRRRRSPSCARRCSGAAARATT